MVTEMIRKHGTNLLKAGIAVVVTNLANQVLREMARDTMDSIAADIRKVRHDLKERATERRAA